MYKMKLIMISLLVFLSVSADANASKLSISDLLLDSKAPTPNKHEATSRTLSAIAGPYGGQIVTLIITVLSMIHSAVYIIGSSSDSLQESRYLHSDQTSAELNSIINETSKMILEAVEKWGK